MAWYVNPGTETKPSVDDTGLRPTGVVRFARIPLEERGGGVIVQGSPVVISSVDYPYPRPYINQKDNPVQGFV